MSAWSNFNETCQRCGTTFDMNPMCMSCGEVACGMISYCLCCRCGECLSCGDFFRGDELVRGKCVNCIKSEKQ